MRAADTHPPDHELLSLADGELSWSRRARVEAHLVGCDRCRAHITEMQRTLADASAMTADIGGELESEKVDVSADLTIQRARLERALQTSTETQDRSWGSWGSWPARVLPITPAWAAAAVLVLAAVALFAPRSSRVSSYNDPGEYNARNVAASESILPIVAFTPGATSRLTATELCGGARPSRVVRTDIRAQVLRAYRMDHVPDAEYELDALITPELGGTTEVGNLWPQRYVSPIWNARVKDALEHLLAEEVCASRLDLARAQQDIARDWIAAYQQYFRTPHPLRAHRGPVVPDDDELLIAEPTRPDAVTARLVLGPTARAW